MSTAQHEPEPTDSSANYPERDPQLFYELAKDRLQTQLGFIDAVDNKLGLLLSLGSALMGILVAVIAIRGNGGLDAADIAAISVSGVLYLVVAGLSGWAYYGRSWDVGPSLQDVWDDLWKPADDKLVKWGLAADLWQYYRANEGAQKLKACLLKWILAAVIAQTLTLAAGLAIVAARV